MRNVLALVFLFSLPTWAYDPMYSDYAKTIGPDVFNLALNYNFFNTSGNIDGSGNISALPTEDSFTKNDLDLMLKYGFLQHLDLGLGFRLRANDSLEKGFKKVTFGPESFILNLRWNFLPREKFNLALDLNLGRSFYKNTEAQKISNNLILGDPGSSIGLKFLAGYWFTKAVGLNGMFGWHVPPNNLSQEILYDLRTNIRFSYFLIGLGFDGIISLKTDIYDSYEQKMKSNGFNTGGSNLFYSFNRQLFSPYGSISALLWDSLKVQFLLRQNLAGSSIDEGTMVGINFLYNFGGGTNLVEKKEKPPTGLNLEGKILKLNSQNKFAKLNLGTANGVRKGMKIFFFRKTKVEDVFLARGYILNTGVNWSIAKVEKYQKNENLKIGQMVKILVE